MRCLLRRLSFRMLPCLLMAGWPSLTECQQSLGTQTGTATTRVVARLQPGPDDSWVFGTIRDVAVDRMGRVYVIDMSDQKIRVFDAAGKVLRVVGGRGRGPGEYTQAKKVEVVNDTLWVADNFNARLTALSLETGKVLRSTRAQVYDQSTSGVSVAGLFTVKPDGMVDATATKPVTMRVHHELAGASKRQQIALFIVTRPPIVHRTYAGDTRRPFGVANDRQPLDNGWLHQVAPHGRSIHLLDRAIQSSSANPLGGRSTAEMRLVEIGWKGDTLRDRRFRVPSRRVTSDDIAAIVTFRSNPGVVIGGKTITASPQEVRDSLYKPAVWPPVTGFFVGLDGSIWFEQPQPPRSAARFWRLTANGAEVAPVVVPPNFRVMRVTLNRIWGLAEDDDGVQSVHVLEVVPPGSVR